MFFLDLKLEIVLSPTVTEWEAHRQQSSSDNGVSTSAAGLVDIPQKEAVDGTVWSLRNRQSAAAHPPDRGEAG